MAANLLNFLLLAQNDSPGPRGDNPSDGGGVLIIVGIILAVVLLAAAGAFYMARRGESRPSANPDKHKRGRVGRL
ncbi:MAG TPA: hypothetical protein VEQ61_08960 [Thermoleophilaceae bacterium]|nr:hypothetical protein [Thermoleophilaceae bacterium]